MILEYKQKIYFCDAARNYSKRGTFYNTGNIPSLVTIKPTMACPLNCDHCAGRAKKFTNGERTMNLGDYRRLFNDLKDLGTTTICISGGEPLTFGPLPQLIKAASQRGFVTILNTNGLLLNRKKFTEYVNNGLISLTVSIDSPCPEVHDRLRGKKGLFEAVVKNLKSLNRSPEIVLGVRMILSRYTFRDIDKMLDLAVSLGADTLSIDQIENDYQRRKFLLRSDEIREFNEKVKPGILRKLESTDFQSEKLKANAIYQINSLLDLKFNSMSNLERGIYWPDNKIKAKCSIPQSFMIVGENGTVFPCNSVEYTRSPVMGSIFEENIKHLWHSEAWKSFRRFKMDFCRFCPMNLSTMIQFKTLTVTREIIG